MTIIFQLPRNNLGNYQGFLYEIYQQVDLEYARLLREEHIHPDELNPAVWHLLIALMKERGFQIVDPGRKPDGKQKIQELCYWIHKIHQQTSQPYEQILNSLEEGQCPEDVTIERISVRMITWVTDSWRQYPEDFIIERMDGGTKINLYKEASKCLPTHEEREEQTTIYRRFQELKQSLKRNKLKRKISVPEEASRYLTGFPTVKESMTKWFNHAIDTVAERADHVKVFYGLVKEESVQTLR